MFCPECGSEIENNAKFCSECGCNILLNTTEKDIYEKIEDSVDNIDVDNEDMVEYNKKGKQSSKMKPIIIILLILLILLIGYIIMHYYNLYFGSTDYEKFSDNWVTAFLRIPKEK